MIDYEETQYGFRYGPAEVSRCTSDEKKGWVVLFLETPKHDRFKGTDIQIYVTKTGSVRIMDRRGEWKPPERDADHE
jgi:hypothetical protein